MCTYAARGLSGINDVKNVRTNVLIKRNRLGFA